VTGERGGGERQEEWDILLRLTTAEENCAPTRRLLLDGLDNSWKKQETLYEHFSLIYSESQQQLKRPELKTYNSKHLFKKSFAFAVILSDGYGGASSEPILKIACICVSSGHG
jgi:hypothetical protein